MDLRRYSQNLNEPVIVQVFNRDPEVPDTINPDTLRKYVGVLKAYSYGKVYLTIKIKGLPLIYVPHQTEFVELFSLE